ncbi:hypothetical protein BAE44_0021411, partial [Dichanthelium oligosanthes]
LSGQELPCMCNGTPYHLPLSHQKSWFHFLQN